MLEISAAPVVPPCVSLRTSPYLTSLGVAYGLFLAVPSSLRCFSMSLPTGRSRPPIESRLEPSRQHAQAQHAQPRFIVRTSRVALLSPPKGIDVQPGPQFTLDERAAP